MPIAFVMTYPQLNSLFFEYSRPSHSWCVEILEAHSERFHPRMVPVYQWEGILFIAIPWDADPKSLSISVEGDWQIVCADPVKMAEFWANHFENISQPGSSSGAEKPLSSSYILVESPGDSLESNSTDFNPQLELPEGLDYRDQMSFQSPNPQIPELPPIPFEQGKNLNHTNVHKSSGESLPAPYLNMINLRLEGDRLMLLNSTGQQNPVSVNLFEPSPFRVVYRTRNDYHGYVVPCLSLERFFIECIKIKAPRWITIVPTFSEDRIEGMVLAWANEDIQSLHLLNSFKSFLNQTEAKLVS